jgi:hypothetical protein
MRTAYVIFGKLPNVNNHPLGENSPNLVTLNSQIMGCKIQKSLATKIMSSPLLEYW